MITFIDFVKSIWILSDKTILSYTISRLNGRNMQPAHQSTFRGLYKKSHLVAVSRTSRLPHQSHLVVVGRATCKDQQSHQSQPAKWGEKRATRWPATPLLTWGGGEGHCALRGGGTLHLTYNTGRDAPQVGGCPSPRGIAITWIHYSTDTSRWFNAVLTLVHRLRRWTNVKPALIQRLVSAG